MVIFHSYVKLPEGTCIQIWIFQGNNFSWRPTFHPSCFPFCTTWIKILYQYIREAWIMDPPKKCHGFFLFSQSYHNTKHHFILISSDLTTQKKTKPSQFFTKGVFQILSGWWFQPTPLKNDGVKVSWDDGNSQLNGKIKFMFQTTNQTNYLISKTTN